MLRRLPRVGRGYGFAGVRVTQHHPGPQLLQHRLSEVDELEEERVADRGAAV